MLGKTLWMLLRLLGSSATATGFVIAQQYKTGAGTGAGTFNRVNLGIIGLS
ncbi:hypothetical protein [Aeromicrobium sp.]|uniref:hypothetical protein n=1 Tax=Aeromicrobium sp. TaxID=1871063 RepID=UPI0019AF2BBF|nr:hypothetical protein [Aeromicrobium sp.]MBC7630430.1 hypothetical protein [Aeromicrobium sp.]